jgi:hypothetical protein
MLPKIIRAPHKLYLYMSDWRQLNRIIPEMSPKHRSTRIISPPYLGCQNAPAATTHDTYACHMRTDAASTHTSEQEQRQQCRSKTTFLLSIFYAFSFLSLPSKSIPIPSQLCRGCPGCCPTKYFKLQTFVLNAFDVDEICVQWQFYRHYSRHNSTWACHQRHTKVAHFSQNTLPNRESPGDCPCILHMIHSHAASIRRAKWV